MKTLGITVFGLTSLCLVGGLLAGAKSSRPTPQATAERQGAQHVDVQVDEVVLIAVGENAVANTRIGNLPAPSSGAQKVTVRVGNIHRQAVGSKASVCLQIPFVADSAGCDEPRSHGTASEQEGR